MVEASNGDVYAPRLTVSFPTQHGPHAPQNFRITPGDDANSAGCPRVYLNFAALTKNHATDCVPAARRQSGQ